MIMQTLPIVYKGSLGGGTRITTSLPFHNYKAPISKGKLTPLLQNYKAPPFQGKLSSTLLSLRLPFPRGAGTIRCLRGSTLPIVFLYKEKDERLFFRPFGSVYFRFAEFA